MKKLIVILLILGLIAVFYKPCCDCIKSLCCCKSKEKDDCDCGCDA